MKLGDPKEIGILMRERRAKLGYTIQQMAQAVGLSPITIMRLELGRVGYIHAKTAKALEVPKRVTHRMITSTMPVGVMADGSLQPVASVAALPPELQNAAATGDKIEISPQKRIRATYKRIQQPVAKPPSLRKKLFMWLAGEPIGK